MAERWEPYEVQFLREVAGYMPGLLISEKLERPLRTIYSKARSIGIHLTANRQVRRWSDEELSLLSRYDDNEVSHMTGRTIRAVQVKRSAMNKDEL
ncbi:hypothetical protein QAA95_028715 [Serratia nevei]|uniref:hypothetical protein n=1 Tax=Serratia nevei TaxID=2703794 RepID=UPI00254B73F9|nr:hypothetical protein [Serratia nevei]MDK5706273.1 hypothetical protein [Serratia nevei]MEC5816352.1 hypothetical protein [Serratia nevei]MEC5843003.1 hypothetical protein [Serratia nevei]MEC5848509.1 hypothetical protein [Serratia nevei]MEC5870115.1 hypothetical protein [Serratia nevei]